MRIEPYMLRVIWGTLPALPRLFSVILLAVSLRTLYSASVILIGLTSLSKRVTIQAPGSRTRVFALLDQRAASSRQLIGVTFYLFALVFFLDLPLTFVTLGDGNMSVVTLIVENLSVYAAFAADISFVFIVIHSIQWIVSARIRSAALRANAQGTPY